MNDFKHIYWCERCYREGDTSSGTYLLPEFRERRLHVHVRKGQYCRHCNTVLTLESLRRFLFLFPFSFLVTFLFPYSLALATSSAGRWRSLEPIRSSGESLMNLVNIHRVELKKLWGIIHSEVSSHSTVASAVREIRGKCPVPPRVIYAAIWFLSVVSRNNVTRRAR
ncbi:MAG TPA: hypothetical protein VGB30_11770 [bacterium]|jgi:hypothetical protein